MSMPRCLSGCLSTLIVLAALATGGCRTVSQEQYDALHDELETVTSELEDAEQRLQRRETRIQALLDQIETLEQDLDREQADAASVESDLELALDQLGELREERLDLRDELRDLTAEVERLREAAIAVRRTRDTAGAVDSEAQAAADSAAASGASEPGAAPSAALRGDGGFTLIQVLGFRNNPQAASRLSEAAPGIAVDTEEGVPILYDSRLNYQNTLVYLAIADPEGRRPRLRLTAQYTSEVEPLYLHTAFISIEGGDPVDPVDPIVLSGEPTRQTDGRQIREALLMTAEPEMLDRLSAMIGSRRFTLTFLGMDRQITHRPSVAERAAMSNILFAYLDLGGAR